MYWIAAAIIRAPAIMASSPTSTQARRLAIFHSAACQRFYGRRAADASAAVQYDEARQLFRPDSQQRGSTAWRASTSNRMWTYEDRSAPETWECSSGRTGREPFVLPVWVRTAQRAVKAFVAPGAEWLAPAVWKAGTTSLNVALSRLTPYCRDAVHSGLSPPCAQTRELHSHRPGPRDWPAAPRSKGPDGRCSRASAANGCARIGTFAAAPHSKIFAFVRDPVDRFVGTALAALSGPINNCSRNWYFGRVCPHTLPTIRELASKLLRGFPQQQSTLPLPDHWLTQAYFLSATDFSGAPLRYSLLGKLETMRDDMQLLLGMLGEGAAGDGGVGGGGGGGGGSGGATTNLSRLEHINQSGAGWKKKQVRALVEKDAEIMAAVCTIYAQDFACFDYPLPPICTSAAGAGRHRPSR